MLMGPKEEEKEQQVANDNCHIALGPNVFLSSLFWYTSLS
jgi:hypothetical protein